MSTPRELLAELADQLGPPDERMVTAAMEELTALVHRTRHAEEHGRGIGRFCGPTVAERVIETANANAPKINSNAAAATASGNILVPLPRLGARSPAR